MKGICAVTVTRNSANSEASTQEPQDQLSAPIFGIQYTVEKGKAQAPAVACSYFLDES